MPQRRLATATELGTLLLAPALAGAALVLSARCGGGDASWQTQYVFPALVTAAVALLSLAAACVLTAGGRPARCVVPAGSSARAITTLSGQLPAMADDPMTPPHSPGHEHGNRNLADAVSFSPGTPGVCSRADNDGRTNDVRAARSRPTMTPPTTCHGP